MQEYKLSALEKIVYFVKNFLFSVLVLIVVSLNVILYFDLPRDLVKYIVIIEIIVSVVYGAYRVVTKPLTLKLTDDTLEIQQGTYIIRYQWEDVIITTRSYTTRALLLIPVHVSREIHVINIETGKDDIFKSYGFFKRSFNEIEDRFKFIREK